MLLGLASTMRKEGGLNSMWTQMGLAIAGSLLNTYQQGKEREAQQKAINAQYKLNLSVTRAALDTLGSRAASMSQEITRDKLRAIMAAEKAGVTAKGQRAVQAAALGTTGKRTALLIEQEISRTVGDVATDADINAQIQEWNLQATVSDQSKAAINALNNSVPSVPGRPSGLQAAVDIGSNILGVYQRSDKYEKADFNEFASTGFADIKSFFGTKDI